MAMVMVALEFVNVAYYILLPWREVGSTNSIAVVAAHRNLGTAGAVIVAALVSIACAGTINGQMFGHGRLVASAAQRGYIPTFFSRMDVFRFLNPTSKDSQTSARALPSPSAPTEEQPLLAGSAEDDSSLEFGQSTETQEASAEDSEREVPGRAMLLNASLACMYLSTGSFAFLVKFVGLSVWGFLFLAAFGVIILRRREPDLHRPYKVTLAIPMIFCIIAFGVVASSIPFAPVESGILGGLFLLRFVTHRWFRRA